MRHFLLATAIALIATLSTQPAMAQNGFIFSKSPQTYAKLSGATSLTQGRQWTSDSTYQAPIGFSFKMDGTTINAVTIGGGSFIGITQGTKQSGFLMLSTGLMDRS